MINSIKNHRLHLTLADITLFAVALIPWLIGWVAGAIVWVLDVFIAAGKAGYEKGRGNNNA